MLDKLFVVEYMEPIEKWWYYFGKMMFWSILMGLMIIDIFSHMSDPYGVGVIKTMVLCKFYANATIAQNKLPQIEEEYKIQNQIVAMLPEEREQE